MVRHRLLSVISVSMILHGEAWSMILHGEAWSMILHGEAWVVVSDVCLYDSTW